jgi:hypothetical protein
MSNPQDSNDNVGYGRPPKEFQFPPGQSGNYAGRPKANKSLNARLACELNALAEARDDKKRVVMTKKRAIVRSIIKGALAGDVRAASIALARARAQEPKQETRPIVLQFGDKKWTCGDEGGEGIWKDTHG